MTLFMFCIGVVVLSVLYLAGYFFQTISEYQKEIDDNE